MFIKTIAFDLDGTIYYGDQLIDGVIETLNFLRKKNIKIFYFTNNSMKKRVQIYEKLLKMGIELNINEVYNSVYATSIYLKENNIKNVYCLGAQGLVEEIKSRGINITDDIKLLEAIIIGLHHDFTYKKLTDALNIINKSNCKIIACNRDRNYPVEGTKLMPGCGPIVASVEEATGRTVDYIVGKPNTYMMELLAKEWNLKNNEILVIGDSIETDIEMARRYHCPSILITKDIKQNIKDTIIINNILDIKGYLD